MRSIIVIPCFSRPIVSEAMNRLKIWTGYDCSVPEEIAFASELRVLRVDRSKFLIRMVVFAAVHFGAAWVVVQVAELLNELELLIACIFKCVNAFVIPCAACLALGPESWLHRALATGVLIFGVLWGVTGTYSAVQAIIAQDD